MNKKITILLVAAVSMILPAVAVADVMLQGNINIELSSTNKAFYFQTGPNYNAANATNSIGFTPFKGNPQALVDLQGSNNTSTYMVNVIDFNLTTSLVNSPNSYMAIFLNVTPNAENPLPPGTLMAVSNAPLTITQLQSLSPVVSGVLDNNVAGATVAVDLSQTSSIELIHFTSGEQFYIGFVLPPGYYQGGSAYLTATLVKLA